MHNCRLTRNDLIDLALDEMPTAEANQLLAELNDCAACREEYATLRNTCRVSGQALRSAQPAESFWPGYQARLQGKLNEQLQKDHNRGSSSLLPAQQSLQLPQGRVGTAVVTPTERDSQPGVAGRAQPLGWQAGRRAGVLANLWSVGRKLLTTSVRVPVPAGLALILLFGISVFVLRARGPMVPVNAIPSPQLVPVETKMVQVPVIQEKVVTRVVYVEKQGSRRGAANQLDGLPLNVANSVARAGSGPSRKGSMSLVGFKPTEQVKLTIIKGSNQDEK